MAKIRIRLPKNDYLPGADGIAPANGYEYTKKAAVAVAKLAKQHGPQVVRTILGGR